MLFLFQSFILKFCIIRVKSVRNLELTFFVSQLLIVVFCDFVFGFYCLMLENVTDVYFGWKDHLGNMWITTLLCLMWIIYREESAVFGFFFSF